MNKDEMKMIEEMEQVLQDEQIRIANSVDGFKQLMQNGVCHCHATALYNANYRKVQDDEIVIKKRQYEQPKKYNRDRKRLRLKWQQAKQAVKDTKKKTKQETARDILQAVRIIYSKDRGHIDWLDDTYFGINYKRLCKQYGVDPEYDVGIIKGCVKGYGIKLEE